MAVGLDLALVVWSALWIWMGIQVAQDIRGLIHTSDTITRVGAAVEETGRALGGLGAIPLAGDRLAEPARDIAEAGRSAVESGRASRRSVQRTGTLLGLSIALIPTLPIALFYVPRRVSALRQRSRVERLLSEGGRRGLQGCLALRAVINLPVEELGDQAWEELVRGEHSRLAELELARIGVRGDRR
jgi:hypothetical protein